MNSRTYYIDGENISLLSSQTVARNQLCAIPLNATPLNLSTVSPLYHLLV